MEYYFLTHHKCGSGWFNSIHFDLFLRLGWNFGIINSQSDLGNCNKVNDYYHSHSCSLLSYNNADLNYFDTEREYKAVHVVRDPRDIIVSGYFSHKKTHAVLDHALESHRKSLQKLSIKEGLIKELDYSEQFLEPMKSWLSINSKNILTIKLEEISKNPFQSYSRILEHYEIDVSNISNTNIEILKGTLRKGLLKCGREIDKSFFKLVTKKHHISNGYLMYLLQKNSFEKKSGGRTKGEVNENSHYRKGVAGDWKNYFDDELKLLFKKRYNDLVMRYDYEDNDNW